MLADAAGRCEKRSLVGGVHQLIQSPGGCLYPSSIFSFLPPRAGGQNILGLYYIIKEQQMGNSKSIPEEIKDLALNEFMERDDATPKDLENIKLVWKTNKPTQPCHHTQASLFTNLPLTLAPKYNNSKNCWEIRECPHAVEFLQAIEALHSGAESKDELTNSDSER